MNYQKIKISLFLLSLPLVVSCTTERVLRKTKQIDYTFPVDCDTSKFSRRINCNDRKVYTSDSNHKIKTKHPRERKNECINLLVDGYKIKQLHQDSGIPESTLLHWQREACKDGLMRPTPSMVRRQKKTKHKNVTMYNCFDDGLDYYDHHFDENYDHGFKGYNPEQDNTAGLWLASSISTSKKID